MKYRLNTFGLPFLPLFHSMKPDLLWKKPFLLWCAAWFLVTLIYLPAWKGGFERDFEGWLYFYNHLPLWELLDRKFAGIQSMYHVTHAQLYVLTKIFGVRPVPWFLLMTGLFALNLCLLCRLAYGIMRDFGARSARFIAVAGALLVALNPAMTEAVVWKACYHYHIGALAILILMICARRLMMDGRTKWIIYSLVLFVPLTFTLEIWYTVPALVFLMAAAYRRANLITGVAFRKLLTRLMLPYVLLFAAHLCLYRLRYGGWISHSAFTTPGSDSLLTVFGRIWSYEAHLFGLARFYPNEVRKFIYDDIGGKAGGVVALCLILGFVAIAYRNYPRWSPQKRVAALFAGFSCISLAVILHFPLQEFDVIFNDRYLFFTAFFQWMLAAMCIGFLLPAAPRVRVLAFSGLIAGLTAATLVLVSYWRQATKVFWAVQDKFRWQDAPVVLLLNLPSRYNGVDIINSQIPSEFPDHMRIFGRNPPRGTVYDVAGYNMQHAWDGANVLVKDSMHLTVTLNQWGAWWWHGAFGANNYENEVFKVDFVDPGHYYELTFKQRPAGMVVLYQQGQEWRVVDWSKVGAAQW
jgi:hypothetical protein